MSKIEKIELIRFTTQVDPNLLSQIKLIAFFSNQKLNESINNSIKLYIQNFETKNNTSISTLIDFQSNFKTLDNKNIEK
jgi:hypothetical protein